MKWLRKKEHPSMPWGELAHTYIGTLVQTLIFLGVLLNIMSLNLNKDLRVQIYPFHPSVPSSIQAEQIYILKREKTRKN
jgi:hypothetical protein